MATGRTDPPLRSRVLDTHCHLTFPDFAGRIPQVLASAAERGVSGCITISTTTKDCKAALAIARTHSNVWCTAGVHPLYSDQQPHDWQALGECIVDPKCVAWGELGLDNHYNRPPRDVQHAVLHEQLAYIRGVSDRGVRKPIVLHCREAFDDLIPVLRESGLDPTRMVFHCFTGTPSDARKALDLGAMISFTGVLTYRNAPEVREAAAIVPLDRVLVETDAPFLSPEPVRGKRPCEPWMASITADRLAEIHGIQPAALREHLDRNATRLFGITTPARRTTDPTS